MNHLLIRRSASIGAAARQALAPFFISDALRSSSSIFSVIPSTTASYTPLGVEFGVRSFSVSGWRRKFHASPGPLKIRATGVTSAQIAVDDFYDDEKDKPERGGDEGLEISKLGIDVQIVKELSRRGITKLFPIQKAVLEPAMQGHDMIGRAKTGTGKTLAFGIPIMDNIIRHQNKHGRGRYPLAIVLAPTRELARQVEKEFKESAPLDTLCVYGGVPISQQMRHLDYGVDVVVGTPGRMIDLLKRGALNLSEVRFVVLDEADQMLAVGFAEDVEIILEKLPQQRQSMMFSATMPSWIRNISRKYLNNPVTIDLVGEDDRKLAEGISIYSIASDSYGKPAILGPLIKEHAKEGKCIVFTQTKRDADRLAGMMGRSFRCEALHGDISQVQREKTLLGFREGRFNILIATDVAARGLDIPNVDLIIHYELPNSSELFVHRSGRTGRAGKKGSAIVIYTHQEERSVRIFEQEVGCKFIELPRIAVEAGSNNMFTDMGRSRLGSYSGGRMNVSGFSRSDGLGRSGSFGRSSSGGMGSNGGSDGDRFDSFGLGSRQSGGYGNSGFGRSSGFGSFSSGRSGGFGEGDSRRFGSPGDSGSGRSSGFDSSSSGRSGGFGGGSGRFGSFGNSGSGRSSNFGETGPARFGSSGTGGFGSSSGGFGGSTSSQHQVSGLGSFGSSNDSSSKGDSWPGRSFMSSS